MSSSTLSILFAVFESTAVVFILLGLLLRRQRARDDFYARWSPAVLREVSIWRVVNAAIGRDFIAIGATLSSLAVGLWFASPRPEVFALACAGWLLLGATGVMLHSFVLVVEHQAERSSQSGS